MEPFNKFSRIVIEKTETRGSLISKDKCLDYLVMNIS